MPVFGTDDLDLGTESGVRLNLILPKTTADGKTYYYVDVDDSDTINIGDGQNHDLLDDLFNGGTDTTVTQEGAHDGADDARSAIVNSATEGAYTLILPTEAELLAFIADPSYGTLPSGSRNDAAFSWTADLVSAGNHLIVTPADSANMTLADTSINATVLFFQVLFLPPPTFGTDTISRQTHPTTLPISFTLPTASSGSGTLSYTLTRSRVDESNDATLLPEGLTFDETVPAIVGTPTQPRYNYNLTYTVRDALSPPQTNTIVFIFDVVTVTVDTAAGENGGLPGRHTRSDQYRR